MRLLPLAVIALGLAAAPALARENCNLNDNKPGLNITFGFSVTTKNGKVTLGDSDDFDPTIAKIELRKRGVDARSVSLASDGCVEAFVQYPDGSWHSDYYDPDTWEQVD